MHIPTWLKGTLAALVLTTSGASLADTPGALPQEDVLGYLEQLVQWQRNAAVIEPSNSSARERIFQDTLQQSTVKAMRSGFKFAQHQASISQPEAEEPTAEGEEETPRQRMLKRTAENNLAVTQLKLKLAARNLTANQRKKLEGNLKLALAKQELYQTVINNMLSANNTTGKDLGAKITGLAREIPELTTDTLKARKEKPADDAKTATTQLTINSPLLGSVPATTTPTTLARPTVSIFSLMGDLFEIMRKERELKDFESQTNQLQASSRELIKTLREQLDAITGAETTGVSIDTQVANFKQIGAQVLPLGEATLWIGTSKTALADWQTTLNERFDSVLRRLAVQLAVLAFTLTIPLVLGKLAKRAISRYVPDPKRKRQANTARRILVGVAIVFILLLNFISDFSSFATFAGFMTAGLAVALQSVLLSLVGHFFFYGRYGVRPGDRVKVAGVVGDIIQIGMMRFYMRELHSTEDGSLQPTGKIVTFPNSILFQPSAFYKYLSEVP